MSYEAQVLAMNVGLHGNEEDIYSDSEVMNYGLPLNLHEELTTNNEIVLIHGNLSVSF